MGGNKGRLIKTQREHSGIHFKSSSRLWPRAKEGRYGNSRQNDNVLIMYPQQLVSSSRTQSLRLNQSWSFIPSWPAQTTSHTEIMKGHAFWSNCLLLFNSLRWRTASEDLLESMQGNTWTYSINSPRAYHLFSRAVLTFFTSPWPTAKPHSFQWAAEKSPSLLASPLAADSTVSDQQWLRPQNLPGRSLHPFSDLHKYFQASLSKDKYLSLET